MKRIIILAVSSLLCFSALAGFKKGNGGNAVVCADQARLLDFYEAEILEGMIFAKDERPWKLILIEKLDELSSSDKVDAELYKDWLQEFDSESLFLENAGLGKINDSLHVVIPTGCSVEQTINQQMKPLPTEKRYWIARIHWDKLTNFDKAGLIFHEFTYRRLQSTDSREVRAITAEVFSSK